jgi:hypothetical protein
VNIWDQPEKMRCRDCTHYGTDEYRKSECRRYPQFVNRAPSDYCGEFFPAPPKAETDG